MNQFKQFLFALAAFAAVLCIVIASAGAMNTGVGIYIVCGFLNLANIYPVVRFAKSKLQSMKD